jgi:hypothetical protein
VDDGATFLDNLLSFRALDAASRNSSRHHGKETSDVPESFYVIQQVQKDMGAAVHAGDLEVFSLACVSGSIARQVLHVSPMMHARYA